MIDNVMEKVTVLTWDHKQVQCAIGILHDLNIYKFGKFEMSATTNYWYMNMRRFHFAHRVQKSQDTRRDEILVLWKVFINVAAAWMKGL